MFAPPSTPHHHQQAPHHHNQHYPHPYTPAPLSPRSPNARSPHPIRHFHPDLHPFDDGTSWTTMHPNKLAARHRADQATMPTPPTPPETPPSPFPFSFSFSPSLMSPAPGTSRTPLATQFEAPRSRREPVKDDPSARLLAGPNPRRRPELRTRTSEQRRVQARERFLGGVRERRSEGLFDGRGEKLMQHDYLAEQRRWARECAAEAPEAFDVYEDLDENFDSDPLEAGLSSHRAQNLQQYPWYDAAAQEMDMSSGVATSLRPQRVGTGPQLQTQDPDVDALQLDDILTTEAREVEELLAMHMGEAEATSLAQSRWGSEDESDEEFEGALWGVCFGDGSAAADQGSGGGGMSAVQGGHGEGTDERGDAMDMS